MNANTSRMRWALCVFVTTLTFAGISMGEPIRTELRQTDGNWQLVRDGKPFFILGVGGEAGKARLKAAGGNSYRTWSTDNLDVQLDEAQKLGLTVTVGIWLAHERHGFSYKDPVMVSRQFEMAKSVIEKYKDHPSVLMWAIGNEMEGFKAGDDPAIWKAVNDIAAMAKKLDPNHPTMTVMAELGGKRLSSVHEFCPDIDIVGINAYGGAPTLATRYRKGNGTKPFIITEYGPRGTWEVKKTPWKAPIEASSTEKAARYREAYEGSILPEKDKLCLGSYAFYWGYKQEATATWFGLFLPDGSRLESVDTLSTLWGQPAPANRCPTIDSLTADGNAKVKPGETIRVKLVAKDPENDEMKVTWELHKDLEQYQFGGDFQAPPPQFPKAILHADNNGAELRMPEEGGGYFLYAFVRDPNGGAAVANVPLYVDAPVIEKAVPIAALPMIVYGEDQKEPSYAPSGLFGDKKSMTLDAASADQPHAGKTCFKFTYTSAIGPAGVIWQHPANDMGTLPGGFNLAGATKLSFWARGAKGGEQAQFVMGVILDKSLKYHDTAFAKSDAITLGAEWKRYELDLKGKDLSRIKTAFGIVVGGHTEAVTLYVDDVRFEE